MRLPSPCCIPPRPSQIASSTKPPPAVTIQAISAAHSICAPFAAFGRLLPAGTLLDPLPRRRGLGWFEGDDQPRQPAVTRRDNHCPGLLRGLAEPTGAGDDRPLRLRHAEDQHLVVGRTLPI